MLVKCYECGREISDLAKVCPQCGAPMRRHSPCRPIPTGAFKAALQRIVHPFAKGDAKIHTFGGFAKMQGLVCFIQFIVGVCVFLGVCLLGCLLEFPSYVGSMALLVVIVLTLRAVPNRKKYVGYLDTMLKDGCLSPEEVAFAEHQKADSIRRMEKFDLICRITVIAIFVCALVGGYVYYFC